MPDPPMMPSTDLVNGFTLCRLEYTVSAAASHSGIGSRIWVWVSPARRRAPIQSSHRLTPFGRTGSPLLTLGESLVFPLRFLVSVLAHRRPGYFVGVCTPFCKIPACRARLSFTLPSHRLNAEQHLSSAPLGRPSKHLFAVHQRPSDVNAFNDATSLCANRAADVASYRSCLRVGIRIFLLRRLVGIGAPRTRSQSPIPAASRYLPFAQSSRSCWRAAWRLHCSCSGRLPRDLRGWLRGLSWLGHPALLATLGALGK